MMTRLKDNVLVRSAMVLFVAACLSAGLSGCGKKSALTPPEESQYPKQYPRQ